jgi:hypothetical protein
MSGIIGKSPDMRSGVIGAYPDGHILQVLHNNRTSGSFSTTSTTSAAISDLVLSITPKYTSSKIYILSNVHVYVTSHSADAWSAARFGISRTITGGSASTIWNSANAGVTDTYTFGQYVTDTTSREMGRTTISHLDSPSTTISTSYQITLASSQSTGYNVMSDYSHAYSEITLMEVAG